MIEASEVILSITTKPSKNIPGWDTSVSYKRENDIKVSKLAT